MDQTAVVVVGVEVHAVATGISAFFAGLAFGGLWFGRWADRLSRPLRLYVSLELAVDAHSGWRHPESGHAAGPFARLEASVGLLAWRWPFALVGLPGIFSWAARCRCWCERRPPSAGSWRGRRALVRGQHRRGHRRYPAGGLRIVTTPGRHRQRLRRRSLNLLAAFGAWLLRGRDTTLPAPARPAPAPRSAQARLAVGLYCLAGGVALGYEVVWSQSIVPFMSTRAFAFAVVLATYLSGLLAGSWLYARRAERIRDPWGLFGLLIAVPGCSRYYSWRGWGAGWCWLRPRPSCWSCR